KTQRPRVLADVDIDRAQNILSFLVIDNKKLAARHGRPAESMIAHGNAPELLRQLHAPILVDSGLRRSAVALGPIELRPVRRGQHALNGKNADQNASHVQFPSEVNFLNYTQVDNESKAIENPRIAKGIVGG